MIAIVILYLLIRMNIIQYGLFITGYSATSLELLLLIAFQVIYGYVFFMIGIFITIFMAGLVAGNLYLFHKIKINFRNFSALQYTIGIIAILTPIILIQIKSANSPGLIIHLIFMLLILLIGVVTGIQFSIGTNLPVSSIGRTASGSYAADSLGSAFGALTVSTLLIPIFGIIKVCLIIGILNFLTGLLILIKKRNL
jgi:spermidine synthase